MTVTVQPLIAVVDDEAGVRTMLRRVLRLADFDVAAFASGEAFLGSLADRVPACVVLDVHMPEMSGFDVKSRLLAMGRDVPTVFITASDDRILDRAVRDARGTALLRKPFASSELLDAVRATLPTGPDDAS